MKSKIAIFLVLFGLLLGVRFLIISNWTPTLACDVSEYDFGTLQVANGKAIGTHTFEIKNNTARPLPISATTTCYCLEVTSAAKEIPANGTEKISVRLTLEQHDFAPRGAWLQIAAQDEKIPPLKIGVKGHAGFSSYTPAGDISFGDYFQNNFQPQTASISVFSFYDAAKNAPELKVHFADASLFDCKITEGKKTEINRGKENAILLERKISLVSRPEIARKLGAANSSFVVETSDGFRREIPLSWTVGVKEIFDCGNRYYLSDCRVGETRRFKIRYDNAIGGESGICTTSGGPLRVLFSEREGDTTIITLEFSMKEPIEKTKKIGYLIVAGKTELTQHLVEFFYSKEK